MSNEYMSTPVQAAWYRVSVGLYGTDECADMSVYATSAARAAGATFSNLYGVLAPYDEVLMPTAAQAIEATARGLSYVVAHSFVCCSAVIDGEYRRVTALTMPYV